jgi:hypothetical protein
MGSPITNATGRKWREGKVRPLQGNSPHDRPVSRGISFTFWRIYDDPFPATPFPPLRRTILRRPVCVFKACGIYRSDVVQPKPNPGAGPCRLPSVGPGPR